MSMETLYRARKPYIEAIDKVIKSDRKEKGRILGKDCASEIVKWPNEQGKDNLIQNDKLFGPLIMYPKVTVVPDLSQTINYSLSIKMR